MSNYCSANRDAKKYPKQRVCPVNGKSYPEVSYITLLYHVNEPWKLPLKKQAYYFCDDPCCDVVYFGIDDSTIKKEQLRTKVGLKDTSEDSLICYCFGVSKAQAQTDREAKAFVVEQTKVSNCSCATHNPAGRCCLKDFPKRG